MIVLGVTGSIGMGKSETTRMFARLGLPVFDADAAVHELYDRGGTAVAPIAEAFPEAVANGAVDRERLARLVLGDAAALKRLEAIVHPLVRAARERFLERAREAGADIAVVDIPLLFESGAEDEVDKVVVVTAPPGVQRARVLERPGMSVEKFESILAKQMPDGEKRKRADFIVRTERGLDDAFAQVRRIVAALRGSEDGERDESSESG